MKPNFFLIGSAKCATTSFCSLLGKHPQVFMCEPKEPNFFSDDSWYEKGFAEYEQLFESSGSFPFRGEGSTRYSVSTVYPHAAERIAAYAPDAKIAYIVRHPMRRIEAAWMEIRSWGDKREITVDTNFNESLVKERPWLVDSANYLQEIETYRKHFPDEQIKILFFEDFKEDSTRVLNECLSFFGADASQPIEQGPRHLNPSAGKTAPGGLLTFVRSQGWLRKLARLAPQGLRTSVGEKYLVTQLNERPSWKPSRRQEVIDQIGEDTKVFLKRYGKDEDYWDLSR